MNNNLSHLPTLSKTEVGEQRITTITGHIFWVHNLKEKYTYNERRDVIRNFSKYCVSISNPSPEQDAYCVLLWYLFEDYLNSLSFAYKKSQFKNKDCSDKYLYVLRNSIGFIKVGITENIEARLQRLAYEFDGVFEVLMVYPEKGHLEMDLISDLVGYYLPIKKKGRGISRECFEDCQDVLDKCLNIE